MCSFKQKEYLHQKNSTLKVPYLSLLDDAKNVLYIGTFCLQLDLIKVIFFFGISSMLRSLINKPLKKTFNMIDQIMEYCCSVQTFGKGNGIGNGIVNGIGTGIGNVWHSKWHS